MAIQTANLGTAPSGAGGDTFRTAATKFNENFTNNAHAASRLVGTQAGNLMEVGAFGLGLELSAYTGDSLDRNGFGCNIGDGGRFPYGAFIHLNYGVPGFSTVIGSTGYGLGQLCYYVKNSGNWTDAIRVLDTRNTTVDSNGFIKGASPIVQLFADKIEVNKEASEQEPVFEKVNIGHYLLKNTEGFSDDGWYIEMPKDANGNVLVAVQYQQLEDNTIELKTFAKKFDEETGDIVPNLEKPRDILAGRWIDIRLQELPQSEFVPPVSNTPASFQPTGIAQAVSEMMNGTEQ